MEDMITLYDAVVVTDGIYCDLSQAISTMTIVLESLEEGLQADASVSSMRNFVNRFPMYYDALNMVSMRLTDIKDSASKSSDKFLEAHKRHKEAK